MGDPLGLRDDACWECIVEELRKSHQSEMADALQSALDSPFRDRKLSDFEAMYRGHEWAIKNAETQWRIVGRCGS